jgi:regulation of enolase protein 1 (concanavalin A-like superfamily)
MQRGTYLKIAVLASVLALGADGAKPAHAGIVNLPLDNAQDIAATKPATPGSTSIQTGVSGSPADVIWTVTGTGADVWGNADPGFQFAYTTLTGDGGITARLLTQVGGADVDWSKTGTMLRESTDPAAADAFLSYASATGGKTALTFEPSFRPATKAACDHYTFTAVEPIPGTHRLDKGPIWMRTQRQGQSYTHLVSDDGRNWMQVGIHDVSIDPTKPVLAGIWASQGGSKTPNVVTFDNVSVTPNVVTPNLLPGPTGLMAEPGNGVVLLTFNNVAGASGYNVYRREVGQTADQAVLVNAKPITPGYFTDATVTNGKQYLYFVKTVVPDAITPKTASAEGLLRSSDALVAPNVPIASNVAGSPGYQVYYWSTTNPATVDLTTTPGMLTVKASGGDIWGANAADSGTFIATPVAGDYSFSAEIEAQPTNSVKKNTFAKAGIMIRDGAGPSDRNAFVFSSCGRDPGVLFEGKTIGGTNNGLYSDAGTKLADTKFPLLLKLTKAGSVISAFQSSDGGATFTPAGKVHDFVYLSPVTYAGIAMCGQTDGAYTTATFSASSVKIQ